LKILKEMLNTLKSIDSTLKRIEQRLSHEEIHYEIADGVSHALCGKKYREKVGKSAFEFVVDNEEYKKAQLNIGNS
jgi:hypothetical protein